MCVSRSPNWGDLETLRRIRFLGFRGAGEILESFYFLIIFRFGGGDLGLWKGILESRFFFFWREDGESGAPEGNPEHRCFFIYLIDLALRTSNQ